MCFFQLGTKIATDKIIKERMEKIRKQAVENREVILQRQRQAVADRNAQTADTLKDNTSGTNEKRGISLLRIPLLTTAGTGSNVDNVSQYGLNLGGKY